LAIGIKLRWRFGKLLTALVCLFGFYFFFLYWGIEERGEEEGGKSLVLIKIE